MKKLVMLVAGAVMAMAPMTASAARRVVVVSRPGHGGFYGGGFYGPGFYGPYWGPGYAPNVYANSGEVKIETKVRDAEVFINGAFAGTTKDVRTMHLRPGSYTIEVKHAGQPGFSERVYVVAGKTLHLNPGL